MDNRQRNWTWAAAAVAFAVGLLLVLNDSSAGWIFFIIGIGYLGIATRAGQGWAAANPNLAKWGLVSVTILLVLLIVILGAVLRLK
jgi:hypothetical protein